MTSSLGGYSLQVEDANLGEDDVADSTVTDGWKNGAFQHDLRTRRKDKGWTLRCVENNVAWLDSSAKKLENDMTGGALTLLVDEGVLHQVSASVYLIGISVMYEGVVRTFDLNMVLKED
jgi:hypothetical protein